MLVYAVRLRHLIPLAKGVLSPSGILLTVLLQPTSFRLIAKVDGLPDSCSNMESERLIANVDEGADPISKYTKHGRPLE